MLGRPLAACVLLAGAAGVSVARGVTAQEPAGLPDARLTLHARKRQAALDGSGRWSVVEQELRWDPKKTAIVVCDMWDRHWCAAAGERVAEMAERLNKVLKEARSQGLFVIHAPRGTMAFYEGRTHRLKAQQAPQVAPSEPLKEWYGLDAQVEPALPVDEAGDRCGCDPPCAPGQVATSEHPAIQMGAKDACSERGDEVHNLLVYHHIDNVIVMGTATNGSVLAGPFAIRRLVGAGKNVVLMRDLTDALYDPRREPYVSHFRATELVVEHVERHWCPTITSVDFTRLQPFRSRADFRPRVALVIGADEREAGNALTAFAQEQLAFRFGWDCVTAHADARGGLADLERITGADLTVLLARGLKLSEAQLAALRAQLGSGRPLVALGPSLEAFAGWPAFGAEVLGCGADDPGAALGGPPTFARAVPEALAHPILNGVQPDEFRVASPLRRTAPLAATATALLLGRASGQELTQPVAWTNARAGGRVFATTLGAAADFGDEDFPRLLVNATSWALELPVPWAPPRRAELTSEPGKGWKPVPVPGAWEESGVSLFKELDGFAWYRVRVHVPSSWSEDGAELVIPDIEDCDETYWNGVRIGATGSFPPRFVTGAGLERRYAIAQALLLPGEQNLVAVRVYDESGPGGITGAAPALVRGEERLSLEGEWVLHKGDRPEWAQ